MTSQESVKPNSYTWLRYWPLIVPVLFCAIVLAIQPSTKFLLYGASPDGYPLPDTCSRFIFDDADIVAWVVRAENNRRGRIAGKKDHPLPIGWRETKKEELEEKYFLEYPPATLYYFRLGVMWGGYPTDKPITYEIIDGHQMDILWSKHGLANPYYDHEDLSVLQLFRSWRQAQHFYAVVQTLIYLLMMFLIIRGFGRPGEIGGPAWLFILPSTLYFTLCRFDVIPAAFVFFAIYATERKYLYWGAMLLGCAVALKMYPLVVAPILLRYAVHSWRQAVLWCVAFAVPIVASYGSLIATDGLPAVVEPMRWQLGRSLEPGMVFYGRFIPTALGGDHIAAKLFRLLTLACVVAVCARSRPNNVDGVLRRSAITVTVFVSLQLFFSPQWWQWIMFLIVPLAGRNWILTWIIIVTDVMMYMCFPVVYDLLSQCDDKTPGYIVDTYRIINEVLIFFRFVAFCAMLYLFVMHERKVSRDAQRIAV